MHSDAAVARPVGAQGKGAGFVALALAATLWGTPFVFAKWAQNDISTGHMMLLRFTFASAALAPILFAEHRRAPIRIARSDWPLFFWAALIGVPFQFLVQFGGLARTTVSHASLMVGVLPAILAVGAVLFANEHLNATRWTAIGISTLGAALVAIGGAVSTDHNATLLGDLMVALSLVGGATWVLLSQRIMHHGYSSVSTSAIVVLLGTAMLAAWTLTTEGAPHLADVSARAWTAVIAMGLFATAATTLLWNWGLSRVPASQAGVFVNLEPLIGTSFGVLIFHEHVGVLGMIGGVLIVGAALVVVRE